MSKTISTNKTVYNKEQFDKTIDRSFKSFVTIPDAVTEVSIEEFFDIYETLYYTIPPEGDENSHTYLIQKSSELVDFDKDTEDIQPLLDEITQLRQQLLDANTQIIELQSGISLTEDIKKTVENNTQQVNSVVKQNKRAAESATKARYS
jgi:hypothetical protein